MNSIGGHYNISLLKNSLLSVNRQRKGSIYLSNPVLPKDLLTTDGKDEISEIEGEEEEMEDLGSNPGVPEDGIRKRQSLKGSKFDLNNFQNGLQDI
jgi:hypothetical protein